ncbi:galactose-binding domain-like protein [Gigaspora rosea]|uniref:Galactose-binding domain-like protein n=1 Tax=Gigaspora rosea TaxID=44941 RepID=A0A397VWI4_9GLOM|nr:galactose-binding domain-like protein [Gigaspora rosea]
MRHITNITEFKHLITAQEVTLVHFHDASCPHSTKVVPVFKRLSLLYKHLNFVKIDVDEVPDICWELSIESSPTIIKFENGEEIYRYIGLEEIKNEAKGSKNGYGLDGLNEYIDLTQIECLNQNDDNNIKNVFNDDDTYLESDVDEQLIISIPFKQYVKLHSIFIIPTDIEHAPKTIKLFANRCNLGFENVEDIEETQLFQLTKNDFVDNIIKIPLEFVKFQNVFQITVFIENNFGNKDTTSFKELVLIGTPRETTIMENFGIRLEDLKHLIEIEKTYGKAQLKIIM